VASFALAISAMAGTALLAPGTAVAQASTAGTVTGQVTDAQGAAIVGAVVILTNNATNGAQATQANSAGRYVFSNVQPGTYTLDVKKDGFKEAVLKDQAVDVGKQLTLNVPMQVGTTTQTVEVTATGAELQTMNSMVGANISGDAIIKLPNLGRDANSLTMLQPNTAPNGGIAGADLDQNSYSLDGGSNSDDMDGSHSSYTPSSGNIGSGTGGNPSGVIPTPADSIEQFSVGVNNQTADVNGAAGSSVSMVTRRGTDQIHGSAYEYYLGSYLGANSWSNNRANLPKAKSHQNRFGASLGGQILPNFLGGKTYLFGNFEARRYPLSQSLTKSVPSDLMRAGIIQVPGTSGELAYNLNPATTTVDGTAYQPAVCNGYAVSATHPAGTGACDPRGIGLNPVVNALWSNSMPAANNFTAGDQFNTLGYTNNVSTPIKSNFFVFRVDHDFGAKNHFTASYHFYSYNPVTTGQVDIGGGLAGDTKGQDVATTVHPELPSMWTAQLTSSLTPNLTNAFHYSYLRNFWQWAGTNVSPQTIPGFSGLGGALEIGNGTASNSTSESSSALIPYNVNVQSVRTRVWDGIGNTFSDDLTLLHGNHIFQFGGKYTNQWDYHERNDNGGGILNANVYQIGPGGGVANSFLPTNLPSKQAAAYQDLYNEVLGIVSQPQTLYTRSGPQLNLDPLGTPMFDESTIPLYNVYFTDSWHIKPNLTMTFGTGYTVEMPPHEAQGKQVELVDQAGNLVDAADYLATTQKFAEGGQVYNPTLGFATVANVGSGLKYPYHPFYGGLSPRVSLAWNPTFNGGMLESLFGHNSTVVRGGWARIYGRLNGVDLVLVPLLGTGLGQPVTCIGASMSGTCNGTGGVDPTDAFRIGTDGLVAPLGTAPSATLPQPFYPGIQGPAAGAGEVLDPNFKPNRSDEFDLTIQRQINQNFSTEVGYTGRILRNEYQAINLDAVPYMTVAGGQQFQQAFANMYQEIANGSPITAQSFFETALGGPKSTYCSGFSSCTAAVASNEIAKKNINTTTGNNVYNLWSDLGSSSSWTLGRTLLSSALPGQPGGGSGQMQGIFDNLSNGWGNYNSVFWSLTMRNWHGLTALSNFTWSRSMGTGQTTQATSEYSVVDPWNMHAMYGPQGNDTPLNYNLYFVYEPGAKTQHGLLGHLTNGWSFAPIFTWNDGGWNYVNNGGDCASFGEMDCGIGSTDESAIKTTGFTGGTSVSRGVAQQNSAGEGAGIGTNSDPSHKGSGMNQFGDNAAGIYSEFRPMVLGLDTTGQSGLIPGLSRWNVDFSLTKDLALSERFGAELSAQASNVFNHFSPANPSLNLTSPQSFGVITGDAEGARG